MGFLNVGGGVGASPFQIALTFHKRALVAFIYILLPPLQMHFPNLSPVVVVNDHNVKDDDDDGGDAAADRYDDADDDSTIIVLFKDLNTFINGYISASNDGGGGGG